MIDEIEQALKLGGNLKEYLNKHKCKIVLDDFDGEWNRITDIEDNEGNKYHFINCIYDDSWWD